MRLGIDVGGTSVKVAACIDGVWRTAQSDRYEKPGRAALAGAIRAAWDALGIEHSPDRVGLCVPGIAAADGRSIEVAVNVPGLEGWDLAGMVCESLGLEDCTIQRTTDAAAALIDWQASTGASGRSLGIAIGTGVGLCVMDGATVVAWTGGGAGHLGQVDVTVGDAADAPVGPDGGRGGLEAYVGARAVEAAGGIDLAFAAGAPAVEALARAIRICHAVYRPDSVVLLGGIGIRLRSHPALDAMIRADLTSVARPGWKLTYGADDYHAARGAASLFDF